MRPAHTAASRGGETRAPEEPGGAGDEGVIDETGEDRGPRGRMLAGLRFTSLRLRLVLVFGLVALTAAVSASGIAYWLNREAVLTRTQDAALSDFHQELQSHAAALPPHPLAGGTAGRGDRDGRLQPALRGGPARGERGGAPGRGQLRPRHLHRGRRAPCAARRGRRGAEGGLGRPGGVPPVLAADGGGRDAVPDRRGAGGRGRADRLSEEVAPGGGGRSQLAGLVAGDRHHAGADRRRAAGARGGDHLC